MMDAKFLRYAHFYMDVALRTAQMSYAERKKVGCVIVKDNNIVAYGWNGMPSGMGNICETTDEEGRLVTNPEVSHAEENAIAKLAKSNISSFGSDVYITLEPCMHCAKLLYSAGIHNVYIKEMYRNQDGTDYLRARGINVQYILQV